MNLIESLDCAAVAGGKDVPSDGERVVLPPFFPFPTCPVSPAVWD